MVSLVLFLDPLYLPAAALTSTTTHDETCDLQESYPTVPAGEIDTGHSSPMEGASVSPPGSAPESFDGFRSSRIGGMSPCSLRMGWTAYERRSCRYGEGIPSAPDGVTKDRRTKH